MAQLFTQYRRPLTRFGHLVAKELEKNNVPIITDYDFFLIVKRLYQTARKVYLRKNFADTTDYKNVRSMLLSHEYIEHDKDFSSAYKVDVLSEVSAEDACCLVHPTVYISHLSAMQRYSLTDRRPHALMITGPSEKLKKEYVLSKVEQDYGAKPSQLNAGEFLKPSFPTFGNQVRGRDISLTETKYVGKSIKIRSNFSRISTIGQTFLDTITSPSLCGGMSHVLDVWKEHANFYIDDIIELVECSPYQIVRLRAGYILNELLGVEDDRVMKWAQEASRGGSRLLDPSKPYIDVFSERWMISLNAG